MSGHHPGDVHLALFADGQLLASGGADKMVRVWDAADGTATRIMRDQPAAITSIAVAPDEEHSCHGRRRRRSTPAIPDIRERSGQLQPLVRPPLLRLPGIPAAS